MSTSASVARTAAERERVSGEGAADAADVLVVGLLARLDPRGHIGRDAVRARGDAAADRLPDREHIRLEPPDGRAAAGSRAERVRLVDDQERPGPARELTQGVVEAGLRQHDADVRQRRLGEHAGDVPGRERLLERIDVVPLDDFRGQRQVDGGPTLPARATTRSPSSVANVSSTVPW